MFVFFLTFFLSTHDLAYKKKIFLGSKIYIPGLKNRNGLAFSFGLSVTFYSLDIAKKKDQTVSQ